jgi:hypothetical protein
LASQRGTALQLGFNFFMLGVPSAVLAVFRHFNALTMLALVLRGRIVSAFALLAFHINDGLHPTTPQFL